MDNTLDKLIDINTSGLVMMACNSHNIRDLEAINQYKQWVKNEILAQMEQDALGVDSLMRVMDEKMDLLQQKLKKGEGCSDQGVETTAESKAEKKQKASSGYKPKSTDMPTKLAKKRKPLTKIILEDCVQLGLLANKRAKYLVVQMAGKQPQDAEREVVNELRDNLHKQVRKLIRKDKKGPWSSPMAQEELRLEIVQTPTVRSMVFLTREILREREEWRDKSRSSITGRIFGKRISVGKQK
jgi:hypothetical protein